ncbi:MAG: type II toxin-antitoxin system PemK/MazF family toxin [Acidimicrobiia bacterium]
MDVGDIYLADLHEERTRRVVIISTSRFTALSGRAIVVPELGGAPDEVPDPWRIRIDDGIFAVDRVRSIAAHRLVDHLGRAPSGAVTQLRRALRAIT